MNKKLAIQEAFTFSWSTIRENKMLVLLPAMIFNLSGFLGNFGTEIFGEKYFDIAISWWLDLGPPLAIALLAMIPVLLIASFVLSICYRIGCIRIGIKVYHESEKISWTDYIPDSISTFFMFFILGIAYSWLLAIGYLFLIIPGILISTNFCFVYIILIDQKRMIPDLFPISSSLTRGVRWSMVLFGFIYLLFHCGLYILLFALLGLHLYWLLFFVYILFGSLLNSFLTYAFIYLYLDLKAQTEVLIEPLLNYHRLEGE